MISYRIQYKDYLYNIVKEDNLSDIEFDNRCAILENDLLIMESHGPKAVNAPRKEIKPKEIKEFNLSDIKNNIFTVQNKIENIAKKISKDFFSYQVSGIIFTKISKSELKYNISFNDDNYVICFKFVNNRGKSEYYHLHISTICADDSENTILEHHKDSIKNLYNLKSGYLNVEAI